MQPGYAQSRSTEPQRLVIQPCAVQFTDPFPKFILLCRWGMPYKLS
ncbi:hypothetical protein [Haliscomenobacter sp.]